MGIGGEVVEVRKGEMSIVGKVGGGVAMEGGAGRRGRIVCFR